MKRYSYFSVTKIPQSMIYKILNNQENFNEHPSMQGLDNFKAPFGTPP